MDWLAKNRDVDNDRDVLMSILAMLVSFAAMAEQASGLPRAACLEILRFLRPAEATGRRVVSAIAYDLGVPVPPATFELPTPMTGDTEALRLAASFRQLAILLAYLLTQARRFGRAARSANLRHPRAAAMLILKTDSELLLFANQKRPAPLPIERLDSS